MDKKKIKELLKEKYSQSPQALYQIKFKKEYDDVRTQMKNIAPFAEDFREQAYCIMNDLNERPTCVICNGYVKFYKLKQGFRITCSDKCKSAQKSKQQKGKKFKLKNISLEEFGKRVSNAFTKESLKARALKIAAVKRKSGFVKTNVMKESAHRRLEKDKCILKETEIYTLNKTIKLCKLDYSKYIGRGMAKVLKKDDIRLYKSILCYTEHIKKIARKNYFNLTCRMILLAEYNLKLEQLYCKKCKHKLITYDPITHKFKGEFCPKCNFNNSKYSRNSQELFVELIQNLDLSKVYYATSPEDLGEKKYILTELDKKIMEKNNFKNQNYFFMDFVYENKVIEFNGTYWHKNTEVYDNLRKQILENNGYKVKIVEEERFKNMKNEIIKECKEFLK